MENKELLNTQTNANEVDSSTSGENLVEIKEVEGTPFQIVKVEQGYFVGMAGRRLTEPVATYNEALERILRKDWNFLVTVMGTIVELTDHIKTIKTKENG